MELPTARTRLLAGLYPAEHPTIDSATRRMLLAAMLAVALAGALVYLFASRDPAIVWPIAVGLAAALVATAVPWHRLPDDAFAATSIVAAGIITWLVAITGGAASPFASLWFLAASVSALTLRRPVATGVTLGIAALALLPLAYERATVGDTIQEVLRACLLGLMAVLVPMLMTVVRASESEADREQEVSSELRRAQEARKEYMSVLAHELRNPLVAIGAAARVLAKQTAGTPIEPQANGIVAEVRHSLELLDALTDVSSIESGRLRSALRPIDICAVVRDGVTSAGVTEHETVILGADRPLIVLGDERRLGQVIRNVVGNASKYAPAGTRIEVRIGVATDRRSAIVAVRDEGPGIPPGERGRLFEKFARLSTAGATRGSGLGLYISREIVKDHSGELWADWPAGGGSVFSFSLPIADGR
ncbi:MAG TPA: ATP-binding protein [Candidatus Limnocylindria bacterium]